MVDKLIAGRRMVSDTLAEQADDGIWKVVVTITESRLNKASEWESKEVSGMAMDSDIDNAFNVATISVMKKFQDALNESGNDSLFKQEQLADV